MFVSHFNSTKDFAIVAGCDEAGANIQAVFLFSFLLFALFFFSIGGMVVAGSVSFAGALYLLIPWK